MLKNVRLSAPSRPVSALLLVAASLLFSTAQAADSSLFRALAPDTADLTQYRWQHRPVVLFAPSATDAHYLQQIEMLKDHQDALAERDIIVFSDTSPADKGQLRSQLQPKGFEMVLVGKDGGMKLRETTPLSAEALLSTIDRMPMRQAKTD
ncbi:hypothetical protein CYR55_16980 [Chimaeribacter californicus]|uniref:DUF4174 domain-containing protein n=1 Tax=Chimaeribacter californicus TaxID=2060067 RepID=A0A2N5DZJ3_9GAMM|nr:DUF4174 domain-containing protein [Chimaeribacter californicus]PLR33280.1 hypothetical protein CYR55_16980 [Chimaeribacter californicus]